MLKDIDGDVHRLHRFGAARIISGAAKHGQTCTVSSANLFGIPLGK
jgi:hypothetical protein